MSTVGICDNGAESAAQTVKEGRPLSGGGRVQSERYAASDARGVSRRPAQKGLDRVSVGGETRRSH